MSDTACIVFSRAPIPGAAKRRLIPALGAQRAAALQARMTRHVVELARASTLGPIYLWCTPTTDHPLFHELTGPEVQLNLQDAALDLGGRMASAFAHAFDRHDRAVIVGSDCPSLTRADLNRAAASLGRFDAVIGAASDGGYIFLGLSALDRAVFEGPVWGSDQVLEVTRERLQGLGWTWTELGPYHDIDRPADLAWLPSGWVA